MAKTPGLNLPYGIDPVNPVPVDANYGPYSSLAQAKSYVPIGLRYDGLTVNIVGSGEYWWTNDLTDSGLAPKGSGLSGFSGYSGAGTSGFSGYSGVDGTLGISGFSGYSGVDGTLGTSGFSGYSGIDGTSGYSGISGFSGVSGAGTSGFSGYSGSGGGGAPVSITRTALQALVTGSTLVPGTTYMITNAQDALSGTITMVATGLNTLNGNGVWSFVSRLPAQGRFRLQTGTSGSVDQVSVVMPTGTKNLMTASIPYTTSRNNTATLVVANINANTATSGCRAFLTTSTTSGGNWDVPTIHIEALDTTTSFVHTMVVSVTTLTISNQGNPVQGFTSVNMILNSFYDLTNDRITYAYDGTRDCSVATSVARIGTLTYNPVTTFRWGDVRFFSFKLIESGFKDAVFRNTTAFVWRRITWNNCAVTTAMFASNASSNVEMFTSNISNVNITAGIIISQCNCSITATNIDLSSLNISTQNVGNIAVTNSTFGTATTPGALNLGAGDIGITIGTVSVTGTAANTIQRCTGAGNFVTLSNCTFTRISMLNNRLYNSFTFSAVTGNILNVQTNTFIGNVSVSSTTFTSIDINILRNTVLDNGFVSARGIFINTSTFVTGFDILDSSAICLDLPANSNCILFISYCFAPTVTWPLVIGGSELYVLESHLESVNFTGMESLHCEKSQLHVVEFIPDSLGSFGLNFVHVELISCQIYNCPAITPAEYVTGTAVAVVNLQFTNCEFFDNPAMHFTDDSVSGPYPCTLTSVVVKSCNVFFFGNLDSAGGMVTELTNSSFINSEVGCIPYIGCDFDNVHIINGSFYTMPAYDPGTATYPGTLTATNFNLQNANLRLYPVANQNIVITNVNATNWNYTSPSYSIDLLFSDFSITNGKFLYHAKTPSDLALGSGQRLTIIPAGFLFKKTTYYASTTITGGILLNVTIGYNYPSVNDNDYFDLSVAAINSTPVGEFGVILAPTTTEEDVKLGLDPPASGKIDFMIEGFIINI